MFARAISTKSYSIGVLSFSLVSSLAKKRSSATCSSSTELSMTTTPIKENALLKKDSLPLFNDIDPKKDVAPAIEFDLNNLKQSFKG